MKEWMDINSDLVDEIEAKIGQNTYYQSQDTNLRNTIQDLQNENNDLKQTLSQEKTQLTDKLLKKTGQLINEQAKTQKLTKTKRVKAILVGKLKNDLTTLNSKLQSSQTQISQLKQDKASLEAELTTEKTNHQQQKTNWEQSNTELNTQLQNQAQTLSEQEQKINTLNSEKTNWQSEKENWQTEKEALLTKQNELLAEIERLKNPPRSGTKLSLETTQYQPQLQALATQLSSQQIKTLNLIWQEQQDKFRQQLQVGKEVGRERERRIYYWGVILFLVFALLILAIKKLKRRKLID